MCTFFVLLCVIYRLTGHAGDQLQRAENSERPEGRKHAGENNGGGTDVCRIFHFPSSWLRRSGRITWGWKDLRRPPLRHLEASHKGGTWKNCVKVKIHRICKYIWNSPPHSRCLAGLIYLAASATCMKTAAAKMPLSLRNAPMCPRTEQISFHFP